LSGQISSDVKKERSRELHALSMNMRQSFLNEQINKTSSVLWENRNDDNAWTGYTDNFIRVSLVPIDASEIENEISNIKIIGIADNVNHCIAESI
jgi:threonylcarbamoyladenosine tRNA methylthiotransferase MtaB